MTDSDTTPHPLEGIDPLIHAPARLRVMTALYVLDAADFTWLINQTGLTWGNLSTHLTKLAEAGYVDIEKGYRGKKPHTMIHMTEPGRVAFRRYRAVIQQALGDLPD